MDVSYDYEFVLDVAFTDFMQRIYDQGRGIRTIF